MSLINDALKRTKDVQRQTPPAADGPALRPVDPAQAKASGARTFLFVMVAAVIVGNFLLWLAFHEKPKNTDPQPATSTSAKPTTTLPVVAPTATNVPANNTPEAIVVAASPATTVTQSPATNASAPLAVVFVDPPKPTVLRLQSIIFGARPSAMIAGKFLFVGDSIQGHKVIAIDKETVTLIGNGQTNVLSLP